MTIPLIDPIAKETRLVKRQRVLGDDPACVLCGLTTIASLIAVSRDVLEAHHIVGHANDEALTAPLCRNCHAEVTDGYRDAGVSLNRPPTLLHKLVAILRALGAMLTAVGQKCAAWAEALAQLVQRLDVFFPTWRNCAEATP